MPNPSFPLRRLSLEAIVDMLRGHQLRITKNRLEIVSILLRADRPLSLEEIHERAAGDGQASDYATVFRIMTLLENLGIAQKVNMNRGCSYYELLNPNQHHDHLICTECGKVTLMINSCPVSSVERTIEKKYGFSH
ncbi:MAG: transcriptional repressor, partial [Verrucomicrobia bacterium]|nr:transcriptional repressor [Verrucomicrobiota bacterium]